MALCAAPRENRPHLITRLVPRHRRHPGWLPHNGRAGFVPDSRTSFKTSGMPTLPISSSLDRAKCTGRFNFAAANIGAAAKRTPQPFHIASPPPIQAVAVPRHLKGRRSPLLSAHRHHIRVRRQNHPPGALRGRLWQKSRPFRLRPPGRLRPPPAASPPQSPSPAGSTRLRSVQRHQLAQQRRHLPDVLRLRGRGVGGRSHVREGTHAMRGI